jgi:hypothetical protein
MIRSFSWPRGIQIVARKTPSNAASPSEGAIGRAVENAALFVIVVLAFGVDLKLLKAADESFNNL